MATRDTGQPASGVTRRDFLKTTAAATAVAGCGFTVLYDPEKAAAYEPDTVNYKVSFTTCPYCSASCGQRVVTALTGPKTGNVIDIYGDFESPMNSGGLCAKGAGSLQLVNNSRRVGAWAGPHPVPNMDGSMDNIFAYDPTYTDGVAYKRTGNGNWGKMDLQGAMDEIAVGMVAARGTLTPGDATTPGVSNSKKVAFFGSSHMNNEGCNLYRKVIANFGTSNVEHQARI